MSNEAKTTSKSLKKVMRKATFTVEKVKGQRVFRAVNKRAHKWAKKVGKRSKLTLEDMRAIRDLKRVKLYAYDDKGTLAPVKF